MDGGSFSGLIDCTHAHTQTGVGLLACLRRGGLFWDGGLVWGLAGRSFFPSLFSSPPVFSAPSLVFCAEGGFALRGGAFFLPFLFVLSQSRFGFDLCLK